MEPGVERLAILGPRGLPRDEAADALHLGEELRAGLQTGPASQELPLLLSGVYRKKVDLLERAIELSART